MKFIQIAKEIKNFLGTIDYDTGAKASLERIIEYARTHPIVDKITKGTKTYGLALRTEKRAEEKGWIYAANEGIKELGVNYKIIGEENIPDCGGRLYVTNHLYGIIDGLILIGGLGKHLETRGRTLKVVGNKKLRMIQGIEKVLLFVDNEIDDQFKGKKLNTVTVRGIITHLRDKGDITIFPAGEASNHNLKDYPWKETLSKIIRYCGGVVPMWFEGPPHGFFYNALDKLTPNFRMAAYLSEAWNKSRGTITLTIGKEIKKETLDKMGKKEITYHLRKSCEALGTKAKV